MLQVNGLKVDVGGVTLIDGVSFTVRAGEKVGLVGRNGAGKTSMLKVIGGATEAAGGSVSYQGGLGYLPQDPRLDMVPPGRLADQTVAPSASTTTAEVKVISRP